MTPVVPEKRNTDWYCPECQRRLGNAPNHRELRDTVTGVELSGRIDFVHNGCGGSAVSVREAMA